MSSAAEHLPKNVRRVIVKVGTSMLTTAKGHFSLSAVQQLVDQIAHFQSKGKKCIVVSSGAIAYGMDTLRLSMRP